MASIHLLMVKINANYCCQDEELGSTTHDKRKVLSLDS